MGSNPGTPPRPRAPHRNPNVFPRDPIWGGDLWVENRWHRPTAEIIFLRHPKFVNTYSSSQESAEAGLTVIRWENTFHFNACLPAARPPDGLPCRRLAGGRHAGAGGGSPGTGRAGEQGQATRCEKGGSHGTLHCTHKKQSPKSKETQTKHQGHFFFVHTKTPIPGEWTRIPDT